MNNKKRFNQILADIKKVKIQGATNIAIAALKAYKLISQEDEETRKKAIRKLIKARPTEPLLFNVLYKIKKQGYKEIWQHFSSTQEKINKYVFKLIKDNDTIYTHCHSTNVVRALIYAKKHGKKFEVYNTETRPLYQGRQTARELAKAGIKLTMFVDSAIALAIEKEQADKIYTNKIFLGCDAILKEGIINKIGSHIIAELANLHKIPLYIIADSWKYFPHHIKIEERHFSEVWKHAPRNIKIRNPAFEFVDKKFIKAILSELGILSYEKFLEKVKNKDLF